MPVTTCHNELMNSVSVFENKQAALREAQCDFHNAQIDLIEQIVKAGEFSLLKLDHAALRRFSRHFVGNN